MNIRTPPKTYVDPGFNGMPRVFIPDDAYRLVLEALTVVCADAAIFDPNRKTLWLAPRITRPMKGKWWWIGGRTNAGERPEEATSRIFKRETGLEIEPQRFQFLDMLRYFCEDREQEPQDKGCDSLVHMFAVKLEGEELQTIHNRLDTVEYGGRLREFGWDELLAAGVHQAVLDVYRMIFPD